MIVVSPVTLLPTILPQCLSLLSPFSLSLFSVHRTGELTNRLASDTSVIQVAMTENISVLFRYTLQMVLSLGVMFYISLKLTAVLVSVVPVIIVGAVQYGEMREAQDVLGAIGMRNI